PDRFAFDGANTAMLAIQHGGAVEYTLPHGYEAAHYSSNVEVIGFSADGRHVFTRTDAQVYRSPDRSPDAVIARARAAVHRTLTRAEREQLELRTRPA
ncbi:MAG TPA: hypothetical protein VFQ76_19375, partial [Longimicrobiaceae bacterium]|nr:hypothetical protein [Longimicrobiaceae bacterium]